MSDLEETIAAKAKQELSHVNLMFSEHYPSFDQSLWGTGALVYHGLEAPRLVYYLDDDRKAKTLPMDAAQAAYDFMILMLRMSNLVTCINDPAKMIDVLRDYQLSREEIEPKGQRIEKVDITLTDADQRYLLEDDLFDLSVRHGVGCVVEIRESGEEACIDIKYAPQHREFMFTWLEERQHRFDYWVITDSDGYGVKDWSATQP